MIETVKTTDVNQLLPILNRDGVLIIQDYISDCSDIYQQTLDLCNKHGRDYEFGRAYRGPSINEYNDSPIKTLFTASWMKDLHKQYKDNVEFGINVFATHDFKESDKLARNGFLHFDRIWCLKFFLYLTDVGVNDGPLCCSPGSTSTGFKLRQSQKSKNYEDQKNRVLLDWPDVADEFPAEPITAKAGSLIVFDTDTFHMGGVVSNGSRLIIRLHCR